MRQPNIRFLREPSRRHKKYGENQFSVLGNIMCGCVANPFWNKYNFCLYDILCVLVVGGPGGSIGRYGLPVV